MLQPGDRTDLADLFTLALSDGPVADWLVPERSERTTVLQPYFSIIADYALTGGIVYGTPDFTGAAVWIEAFNGIKPIDDFHARLVRDCGPDHAERLIALDRLSTRMHPHNPHWYLMALAVHPDHRGQGLGAALLHHHHQGIDVHSLPAYLEASTVEHRRLYLRHGYLDLMAPETLPGGPSLYPMWRQSHPVS